MHLREDFETEDNKDFKMQRLRNTTTEYDYGRVPEVDWNETA